MTIIGNIFLSISTLIFFVIVGAVLGKEPARGGDAAGGYAMGTILFHLALMVCLTIATIAIAWKGGFDWISANKSSRYLLVALGLFAAVLTGALSALFKYESGPVPTILRVLSGFAPVLIPLVLIVSGFIMLNSGFRDTVPAAVYQWPLKGVMLLSLLGIGAGIFSWISSENENARRKVAGMMEDQARYHQGYLDDIDSCNVLKDMSRILVFTDANHDQDVREAAIAKVKTNPEWQQELVRLLENQGASEAFNFLASNEVDDKNLFLEPVNTGILSIADWFRRRIREASHSSHFYPDMFTWEVDRILRTVAKFDGMGKDYRPAIRELRAALDEPASVEKVTFHCTAVLDNWLKKHQ